MQGNLGGFGGIVDVGEEKDEDEDEKEIADDDVRIVVVEEDGELASVVRRQLVDGSNEFAKISRRCEALASQTNDHKEESETDPGMPVPDRP